MLWGEFPGFGFWVLNVLFGWVSSGFDSKLRFELVVVSLQFVFGLIV